MVRLPLHSIFQGVDLYLSGGKVEQVNDLEIGKHSQLTFSPTAGVNTDEPSKITLDSLLILGGGSMEFTGSTANDDEMRMTLFERLVVRGGGLIQGNKLNITGESKVLTS